MGRDSGSSADEGTGFFAGLPLLKNVQDTCEEATHRAAPDDWALVVTEIVDSTIAIADGRHKTVNFVAATVIAALKNLCAPESIPFLFGGDGAVVLVPPRHADAARHGLARVRGLAAREFGLRLRVELVSVGELRRHGSDVRVGRYEPSPDNSFGVVIGSGVGRLDAAVRGYGAPELIAAAAIPESLGDRVPADLSCRWDKLRSQRGKMVTLIVQGASDLREIPANVMRLAGQDSDPRPVHLDSLRARWPLKGFVLGARAPAWCPARRSRFRSFGYSAKPWWFGGSFCSGARSATLTRIAIDAKSRPTPIPASTTIPCVWSSIARSRPLSQSGSISTAARPTKAFAAAWTLSTRHSYVSRDVDPRWPACALRGWWRRWIHQRREEPEGSVCAPWTSSKPAQELSAACEQVRYLFDDATCACPRTEPLAAVVAAVNRRPKAMPAHVGASTPA